MESSRCDRPRESVNVGHVQVPVRNSAWDFAGAFARRRSWGSSASVRPPFGVISTHARPAILAANRLTEDRTPPEVIMWTSLAPLYRREARAPPGGSLPEMYPRCQYALQ